MSLIFLTVLLFGKINGVILKGTTTIPNAFTVSVMIDTDSSAKVTFVGPNSVDFFGLGFNAKVMSDEPWVMAVGSTNTYYSEVQVKGYGIKQTFRNKQCSEITNIVSGSQRKAMYKCALNGAYSFPTTAGSINLIYTLGGVSAGTGVQYHSSGIRGATTITLDAFIEKDPPMKLVGSETFYTNEYSVDIEINTATSHAKVTIMGTASGDFFGLGFNAEGMSDEPWVMAVGSTNTYYSEVQVMQYGIKQTYENKQCEVVSNKIIDNERVAVLKCALKGDYYNFPTNEGSIKVIYTLGGISPGMKVQYHSSGKRGKGTIMLTKAKVVTPKPTKAKPTPKPTTTAKPTATPKPTERPTNKPPSNTSPCTVVLYDSPDASGDGLLKYGVGGVKAFTTGDNAISSIKIIAQPDVKCYLQLFQEPKYKMRMSRIVANNLAGTETKVFTYSLSKLQMRGFKDNTLSSLKLSGIHACVVRTYTNDNYSGKRRQYGTGSHTGLNSGVSSIIIYVQRKERCLVKLNSLTPLDISNPGKRTKIVRYTTSQLVALGYVDNKLTTLNVESIELSTSAKKIYNINNNDRVNSNPVFELKITLKDLMKTMPIILIGWCLFVIGFYLYNKNKTNKKKHKYVRIYESTTDGGDSTASEAPMV